MLVVGLTGGIGCGKSLVSDLFHQKFDVQIIDADIIARDVSETPHVNHLLYKSFGEDYFDKDHVLLRDKLREAVFTDSKLREKLEEILHPLV